MTVGPFTGVGVAPIKEWIIRWYAAVFVDAVYFPPRFGKVLCAVIVATAFDADADIEIDLVIEGEPPAPTSGTIE